ncbi:MAG TPA: enoyl-CoA hydratase/isomerase family protein [Rhizomicrobium sp.]
MDSLMPGTIHLHRIGAHVALLQIDNPPANSLGDAMRASFVSQLDALESDLSVRALVLTGTGRAFCSGDDLKEQKAASTAPESVRNARLADFANMLSRVESFRVPVISAINGFCVGGGLELAVCCDIRVASSEARFTCAGVNVGLIASAYRLPRLLGVARAKHMLLTGSPFDAQTAERFGLVTAIYDPQKLENEAISLAERIASRAPLSVEATKRAASSAIDFTPEEIAKSFSDQLTTLAKTADHREALAAFHEKREPKFERK